MTYRENILKSIRFETPEHIPMSFHINAACWHHYDQEALKDLMEEHKFLFPSYQRPTSNVKPDYALNARKDHPYTDFWGCTWHTSDDGITGSVFEHPLAEWPSFRKFKAPDPEKTDGTYPVDWRCIRENVKRQKKNGELIWGGLPHGHTFLRLQDLRGYENLLFDMLDEVSNLPKLVGLVEEFNYQYVMKWLELEPDIMSYAEDLGMQAGPMLSPDGFRRYIKPVYQRIMKPARDRGCVVHMHSDGDIRTLVDDLIDGGVEVLNLQDLVNGIDWIAERFAGRVCIDLDIDRQRITAGGTPEQIDALIREEVQKIGSKKGGLMMVYGLYPGVPLKNVKALMDAMEKYATYYA
jgi:uroporphyrinogen decarboxylase